MPGCASGSGEARRRYPRDRRIADGRRKFIRERVSPDVVESGCRWRTPSGIPGKRWVAGGAKKSEREPVTRRAIVEVRAMVATCVEGDPAGGEAPAKDMGVRVGMIVPSFKMSVQFEERLKFEL